MALPETNSERTRKWMVGVRSSPFGIANFQGRTVSFREGNHKKMSFLGGKISISIFQMVGFTRHDFVKRWSNGALIFLRKARISTFGKG